MHIRVGFYGLAIAALLMSASLFIAPNKTQAITGSDFKPGRIIDDAIFFNNYAMNPDQIQNFLNAKVPVCDRNHAGFTSSTTGITYNPPFICLNEYQENPTTRENNIGRLNPDGTPYSVPGGKSAAQLIWEVSQDNGINPQVILVMLQKEQGLVTDTWPTSGQYKIAMGYACPDTAACDSAYFGFYNQISSAAKQLRRYVNYPDSYNFKVGVTRYIGYNPSSTCGGSNIYLQTAATAALYNYTPYQPNAGALQYLTDDNPGGTAPCGAYGNRNFWWFFNKWFGSPYGSLFRTLESGSLYYTNGKYRFIVPSVGLVNQYGLGLNDVRYVTQQELDAIPLAPSPFTRTLGQIIKSDSDTDADGPAIYLISNSLRHRFESMDQLTAYGFTIDDISYMPIDMISRVTLNTVGLSDYVKASDDFIYKMENGTRRAIFEFSKFVALNPAGKVTTLSEYTIGAIAFGTPIIDGDFAVIGGDSTVRLYNTNANYYTLTNISQYVCWGIENMRTYKLPSFDMVPATDKGNLRCTGKDSSGKFYLAINGTRYELSGGAHTQIPSLPDSIINRLPLGHLQPVMKGSGPELSFIEGDLRKPIPSMSVFTALGYSSSNISQIPDYAYYELATGSRKYAIGSLILESNRTVSVITGTTSRSYITSPEQFNSYGFRWGSVLPADAIDVQQFPDISSLGDYVRNDTELILVDSGYSYVVSEDLITALNIDKSTIPIITTAPVLSGTSYAKMSKFIKSQTSSTIYLLENGKKRPYASWDAFIRDSQNRPQDIVHLSHSVAEKFTTGPAVY